MQIKLLVVFFCVSTALYSQVAEIHFDYEVRLSLSKVFGTTVSKAHLSVFNDHSIYYHVTRQNEREKDSVIELPPNAKADIRILTYQARRDKTYHNLLVRTDRKNEMLSYENIKLRRRGKNYFIREKLLQTKDWQLHDTTKEIAGFTCNRATIDFGGRSYEAWYTLDIPTNIGPWKIHGLPGAIVNVKDSTKEVSFKLIRVEYNKFIPKSKKTTFPSDIETISCNELMELRKKVILRQNERWEAFSDRDVTFKMVSNVTNSLQNSCD